MHGHVTPQNNYLLRIGAINFNTSVTAILVFQRCQFWRENLHADKTLKVVTSLQPVGNKLAPQFHCT